MTMNKTQFEVWQDRDNQRTQFRGSISDRDLSMNPKEIVAEVKQGIISAIVSQVMEKLSPELDRAIEAAFCESQKKT